MATAHQKGKTHPRSAVILRLLDKKQSDDYCLLLLLLLFMKSTIPQFSQLNHE